MAINHCEAFAVYSTVAYSTVIVHISPMQVDILALPGVLDSALSVTLDVLSAANRIAQNLGHATPFRYRVLSSRRSIQTGTGRRTNADAVIAKHAATDALVVLGMNVPTVPELDAALRRPDIRSAIAWIGSTPAKLILTACCGAFLCAESGLLNGKTATTSWWLAPLFRQRYPNCNFEDQKMVVQSGRVVSAGAALSQVDLMLWLVRRVAGPQVARLCTRYLVIDERASQTRYVAMDQLASFSPQLSKVDSYVRRHLTEKIPLAKLAKVYGGSQRTLERHMHASLGMSPVTYVQRIRVEKAVHLAQTTKLSMSDITFAVGYVNETSLRRILHRELRTGIAALRRLPSAYANPG
jgi:transcriptional regulator GlxA family with amidase domain